MAPLPDRLRFVRPADQPTVGGRTDMDLLEYAHEFQRTGAIVPR